jgi:uncharacterized repeat protein (TIGR01451 family)
VENRKLIKALIVLLKTKVFKFFVCFLVFSTLLPSSAISAVLDWDVHTWPAPVGGLPTLSRTYSVGGSNIGITISGNTNRLITTGNPVSPETNQYLTGGTTNQEALFIRTDFVNTGENIVITMNFSHPGGVSDLSFTVWDVDATSPQWIDRVQVTAIAGGSTVNPSSISDGVTNNPGINTTTGFPTNANAANNSADGNATFSFNQTNITQVRIVYSNVTTGTPGNQWISIHDLTFDVPPTVTKQFSPNPITAGGVSRLTINLGNNDTNTATLTSSLVDNLPSGVTVANPANIGGTCLGAKSAPVGGSTITYANGSTIPVGGCTITVDVTSATAGTYTNTITAGALQTDLGNNAAAASDSLTVNSTLPPTVTKSFSPSVINSGGTSQLTIAFGNTNASAITLIANMDDNLPIGVTVTSLNNVATTCTDAAVNISINTRVRYNNGATIPAGGCNIVVNVTSNTLGVKTNTIAAAALQTNAGNNASPASANITVNSGGGVATCPSGTTLVNLGTPRNADVVVLGAGVPNMNQALGGILPLGSTTDNSNSARLTSSQPTLVLDLSDTVPQNGTIILSIARNNNAANYDIDASSNNISFAGPINFSAGPNDISQRVSYTVPSGSARYIRFDRNAGSLWVDGVQYSQICQTPPTADLSIVKTDSSLTYTPGGTSTYVLTITNNGPDAVTGATIQDLLPNGITLSAQWSCSASGGSSCSAASGGSIGGSAVSLTANILNGGVITVSVPVQFSANMGDY